MGYSLHNHVGEMVFCGVFTSACYRERISQLRKDLEPYKKYITVPTLKEWVWDCVVDWEEGLW